VINAVVYAELSVSFSTIELLNGTIATMQLTLRDIPTPALFLAGKAHLQYQRRGGTRTQVLPDFFIGAHAAVEDWPLLTRDGERFRTCFAGLHVISP
jgi:predicted nucleic acid-binding protein